MLYPLFEVRHYRGEVVTHSHDFHQVVLPLGGRLSMAIGNNAGHVTSDCVALVAAGERHRFNGSESNSFLVLDLPTDSPNANDVTGVLLWKRARLQPFIPVEAELLQLIRYVAQASERGQLHGTLTDHASALLLGAIATQLGVGEQGTRPTSLRVVDGYINAHLEWPLTVADMAQAACVSSSRLHALFRDHLETTPQKYVAQRRLQRASELLAHTTLSVMEVAHRVGYGDQAAFTRAFRKQWGVTPLTYRSNSPSQ